jgi:hypothetical protein
VRSGSAAGPASCWGAYSCWGSSRTATAWPLVEPRPSRKGRPSVPGRSAGAGALRSSPMGEGSADTSATGSTTRERRLLEPDVDAEAAGEAPDHVVAQVAGGRHEEGLAAGQPSVGLLDLPVRHADPVVDDRDHVVGAVRALAVHLHVAIGGRVRQGVLQQLGQEVGQLGAGRADDHGVVEPAHGDPAVLLDLGQRRPDDVADRDRLAPPARAALADQHQQALGVAAHACNTRWAAIDLRDAALG